MSDGYGGISRNLGRIYKFTSNGASSTFASGLDGPESLAFDSAGNLYVADRAAGNIYKFTPGGTRSTFASGLLSGPFDLAFDNAGNLFVTDWGNPGVAGYVYKYTSDGVRSTFAQLSIPLGLAFDSSGNLFVMDVDSGHIYKFTPGGVRTVFAKTPFCMDQTGFLAFWPPSRVGRPSSSVARRAAVADFNGDGKPDYVLYNAATRQTAIWHLNNNVLISGVLGPTLPAGWGLRGAVDFNSDSHPDYGLFNSATRQTAIWDLSGPMFIGRLGRVRPVAGPWSLRPTLTATGNQTMSFTMPRRVRQRSGI